MILNLNRSGENGYAFSEDERKLMQQERQLSNAVSFVAEFGGLEVFNPQQIPELFVSDDEHDEICQNTIEKVLSKL